MSLQTLEKKIWNEAKVVFNNPKLRLKDLLEWSTSEEAVKRNLQDGDVIAQMPETQVWVAISKTLDKRV